MPVPPPPPPPSGFQPPAFSSSKSDANSRNQLLKSIHQGTKLKKVVTNDRSAPIIDGKFISSFMNGP